MTKTRMAAVLTMALVMGVAGAARADVRADEKTHVEFAGMLGRMVNIFGGKAAREGVTSSIAVKGDRKATLNDTTGQIIDLTEEKIYDLDLKRKSYKVTTFTELRRRMEEAQKKAEQDARKEAPEEKPSAAPDEKQIEIDVDVKNTGQKKTVNGFDTREEVVIVTVREKGKTLEQEGGMVLTANMWLAPKIAAMKEIADFDIRYAQKLYGGTFEGISAEQMAAAMAMYPLMKQAIGRMNVEGGKLDGTPVSSKVTLEAVKSEAQMAEQAKQNEPDSKPTVSGGVGGLLGGIARRAAQKKLSGDATARTTFITATTDVLKVATEVPPTDVAVPTGFKENR